MGLAFRVPVVGTEAPAPVGLEAPVGLAFQVPVVETEAQAPVVPVARAPTLVPRESYTLP